MVFTWAFCMEHMELLAFLVLQCAHRHKHTLKHTSRNFIYIPSPTFLNTASPREAQVFMWLGDYNFVPARLLFMLSK